jgi:hypothetical protein
MPRISLVVCVYREQVLLRRLLEAASDIFDDFVVVHDGAEDASPDSCLEPIQPNDFATTAASPLALGYRSPTIPPEPGSVHELVDRFGGRFFIGPRGFQQEPHWPFAWQQAKYDWILRLDADEFPSAELKAWLQEFRSQIESPPSSGYTCIWPLWDGRRAAMRRWPGGRCFLFHRQRVRFFGMAEQVPIADTPFGEVGLVLHHQPMRKSYGVRNIAFRRQAFHWRRVIAQSLVGKPTDLARWRWSSQEWPPFWQQMREHPLKSALRSLLIGPVRQSREMWKAEGSLNLSALAGTGLHHFMLGVTVLAHQCRMRVNR